MVRFISDDRTAPTSSTASLQVVAAGLPRAATSSIQAAVEQLGFSPCMHMAQIVPHASRSRLMIDAIVEKDTAKRQKLIHQLIEGHASLCDFPVCFFIPDLMDMYPDIKIVLNQRQSAEVWAKSAWDSLGFLFTWKYWLVGRLFETDRLWYKMNMTAVQWTNEKYGIIDIFSPEMHNAHYQMVRDEAAKRGLEILEFRPEQGWKPLCDYLGKEVPVGEFPRLNDAKAIMFIKMILVARGLTAYAVLGLGLWAGWMFYPSILSALKECLP
jgi:hypothetical protein